MTLVDPSTSLVGDVPSPAHASATSQRGSRRAMLEEAVLPPLVALLLAAVVGDLLILAFGQSPSAVYRLLGRGDNSAVIVLYTPNDNAGRAEATLGSFLAANYGAIDAILRQSKSGK